MGKKTQSAGHNPLGFAYGSTVCCADCYCFDGAAFSWVVGGTGFCRPYVSKQVCRALMKRDDGGDGTSGGSQKPVVDYKTLALDKEQAPMGGFIGACSLNKS